MKVNRSERSPQSLVGTSTNINFDPFKNYHNAHQNEKTLDGLLASFIDCGNLVVFQAIYHLPNPRSNEGLSNSFRNALVGTCIHAAIRVLCFRFCGLEQYLGMRLNKEGSSQL